MSVNQTFYIITSMRGRNGKTTLSRAIADYLQLSQAPPIVFDTDLPQGVIEHCYPGRSMLIDLEKVPGQMQLFDTILGGYSNNYVLDLSHRYVESFFSCLRTIGFEEEARTSGLNMVVFYILDRDRESRRLFRPLSQDFPDLHFLAVENQGLSGAKENETIIASEYVNFIMPELEPAFFPHITEPEFSFANFLQSPPGHISIVGRSAIRDWTLSLFEQLNHISLDLRIRNSDFLGRNEMPSL